MSIRSRLILLVLALLTPSLIAALLAIGYVYQEQLERVSQSMREATRAMALAVDRDLSRRDAIIETLATSPALLRGDLAEFYAQARLLAPDWSNSIILSDPEGQQLLNTRVPFGDTLPKVKLLTEPISGQAFSVSNLFMAPIGGQWSFNVRRPVLEHGRPRYILAMSSFARQVDQILHAQQLPSGWLGVVLDRQWRVVARNQSSDRFLGHQASDDFVQSIKDHDGGFVQSVSLDGTPLVSFYAQAPISGWSLVIGVPRSEFTQGVVRALLAVGGVAFALAALAVLLAFWIGRKISRPLHQLDHMAQAMGAGALVTAQATGLREADRTALVLAQASERIHEHREELNDRIEEAVAQSQRSLQALQQGQKLEALGRLTGGISHDFNNLLQTLSTGLQLASMLSSDPRVLRALEACGRSVERGTALIRQLMAFSQHRSDAARPLDLVVMLRELRELLEGGLPSRVRLLMELPDGPCQVRLDPLQAELAVLNLAFNARDAMPDGGALTISLRPRQAELPEGLAPGKYLELSLCDQGEGMSEEVRARACEPFFTTKPVGEGTGLGLAQVYGFVREAGGHLELESTPGLGTCVRILLPAVQTEIKLPASTPVSTALPRGDGLRLLLVDDDSLVRQVVGPALEELGYQVTLANNADQALTLFHSSGAPFDIVFSDIVMPGSMDGVGLAQRLREQVPDLPVLLATGYSERQPEEHGFSVIDKPYSVEGLVLALHVELAAGAAT